MRSDLDEDHPWHPSRVTREKLEKFHAAISKAAEKLWKRDEDGDLPVNWDVTDRTRFQPFFRLPVPYDHHAETEEDHDQILSALISNLDSVIGRLNIYMRCREGAVRTGLDKDTRLVRNVAKVMAEAAPVKVDPKEMMAVAETALQWVQQQRVNWT